MKKLLVLVLSFFVIAFLSTVSLNSAFAQESNDDQIPEKEGTYDVPKNKNLKVRVFIHSAKQKAVPQPVLSCTDPDSTAVDQPTGWRLPSSWTYSLNPASVPSSVGSSNLPTISANSFAPWSAAISGKVAFSRSGNVTNTKAKFDGKNIIAWGRTSGSALAVTYTWYYPSTSLVAEVDTIFNKRFPWSWTNPSANTCSLYSGTYDAQDILTHELGHWMGLNDHYTSSYVDNTMYGYGSPGEIKKNTLTTGDITGTQAIYP